MGAAPVQSPRAEDRRRGADRGRAAARRARRREVKDGRRVAEPRLKLLTGSRAGESHESDWSLQITLGPSLPAVWRRAVAPVRDAHRDDAGRPPCPARRAERGARRLGDGRLHRPAARARSGSRRRSCPTAWSRTARSVACCRWHAESFDASSTLHCWIELHGAALDTATGQPRAQAAFVARSLDGREWASGPADRDEASMAGGSRGSSASRSPTPRPASRSCSCA